MKNTSKGFALIELLVIVGIIAAIGLMGYKLYAHKNTNASNAAPSSVGTTAKESATTVTVPPIQSKDDLDKALKSLDDSDQAGNNNQDESMLSGQENDF